ncbi:MAG: Lrp/AsnC ligand binding domain-containing protein [Nitrosarchaeum sp.]
MVTAHVLINCNRGQESSTIASLRHLDSVKEVQGTFGAYNIIAKLEHAEKDKLREMITWNIGKMDDITSTLTLIDTEGYN